MTTDPLESAQQAIQRGFTPLPLWPKTKRPVHSSWTKTTSDEATSEFTKAAEKVKTNALEGPLNVGLVLGHGGLVDIDLDHHRAVALARIVLPDTPMRHGRASARASHWWYRVEDYQIGTKAYRLPSQNGKLGSTIIEYRSTGGQTMIPPSWNPDHGEQVLWEGQPFGGDEGPSIVHGKTLHSYVILIALLVTLTEYWPHKGGRHDAYVALAGALLRDADSEGNPRLHPFWDSQIEGFLTLLADLTHDDDGADSRIDESVPSSRRKIISGAKVRGWPTLARMFGEYGEEAVSSIRDLVTELENLNGCPRNKATRQREDDEWWDHADTTVSTLQPATSSPTPSTSSTPAVVESEAVVVADDGPEDEEERGTWQIVAEHDKWLDDQNRLTSPVLPGVAFRDDGVGLFYPGRVNLVYGPSESGKTLIVMKASFAELARGGRVLMVDLENGYDEIHERMQNLGLPAGMRTPGWGYIEAEQPIASLQRDSWGGIESTPTGRKNQDYFSRVLSEFDPTLIILDGTTTLFTMHGLDPNKSTGVDTITSWLRRLCARGSRTVIMIDHTNKKPSIGDLPTGSQHKKSMVQGTMLQVHGEGPEIGQTTRTMLYGIKDRPGKVKRSGIKDQGEVRVADVMFVSDNDGFLDIQFKAPDPSNVVVDFSSANVGRPKADRTTDVEEVKKVFAESSPGELLTRQDIEEQTPAHVTQGKVREALKRLIEFGVVEQIGGGRSTSYVYLA